ncbi:ankyrin repeat domain-containing protein [Leptospira venezuelensis]|uniref:ankyrin repeat domain-containing protein n=1 Tax=Leptospira venezuelensis TaxID=1958811 RepID=UPI0030044281
MKEYLLANGSKAVFTSRLKDVHTPNGTHQIGARNAFHYATEPKQTDPKILDVLAKAGTNLNHRDAEGKTPLMEAIQRKNISAAQKLIQLGSDLTLADNQGKTVLDLAKEYHLDEIERILAEKLSSKTQ